MRRLCPAVSFKTVQMIDSNGQKLLWCTLCYQWDSCSKCIRCKVVFFLCSLLLAKTETFTLLSLRCATKQQTSANEGLGSVDPQLERQVETIRNLVDSYMKVWPNTQSFPVGFSYKVNNISGRLVIPNWEGSLCSCQQLPHHGLRPF